MNRLDNIIIWLFLMGIVGVGIFLSFYVAMFLLPIILLVAVGYGVYILAKAWWLNKKLKEQGYVFEIKEKGRGKSDVIDAEFEIINEKKNK